jgi:hypothetical protein
MIKLAFVIIFLARVCATDSAIDSIENIEKSLKELEIFCHGKKRVDFCSMEHLELAYSYLIKQKERILMSTQKELDEKRRAKKIRHQNRKDGLKMMWLLREYFLDRHI